MDEHQTGYNSGVIGFSVGLTETKSLCNTRMTNILNVSVNGKRLVIIACSSVTIE